MIKSRTTTSRTLLVGLPAWGTRRSSFPVGIRAIDLDKAAESQTYCDEYKGRLQTLGLEITELTGYLAGQVLCMHPAYEVMFEGFHPPGLRGAARTEWASGELEKCVHASVKLGLNCIPVLSGAFAWHTVYPWPQRPQGIIEEAFQEQAKRWRPILDLAHENGCVIAYELHPGSDIFDGATFEMFLDVTDNHPAACLNYDPSHFLLQCLDYLEFIDIYQDRIRMFHVKDAEFNPTGRQGVYSGFQGWADRAGRFRSLGDGQVDFGAIFSKLTKAGFDGWAVVEWECCLKHPEDGAREGAQFVKAHTIRVTDRAFDDFANGGVDQATNRRLLGLDS